MIKCKSCSKLRKYICELEETIDVMNSIPGVKVAIQRWKLGTTESEETR